MENNLGIQNITVRKINERKEVIDDSDFNFLWVSSFLWDVDKGKQKFIWLHTIDPYGYTLFNKSQIPYVVKELGELRELAKGELVSQIESAIKYFNTVDDLEFIEFIGD